ncbi:nitrogen regulatory IIA protein [Flavobacterium psychrotrophum]|uniref:nitrogen regulatory IIA protein n=1 Tax=Flavobacterium psychrotrophum TaxID=2294119 RepID=UPI0013C4D419|nr:nitrogen regulatory IIA protein [Flavobacterium psychrotrophum]
MKAYTTSLSSWMDTIDRRWKQLPARESRRIILYSFAGYLLITLMIIVQVVYQLYAGQKTMEIKHISNPVANVKASKNIN